MFMENVFISIGSNQGNREEYCRKALEEIDLFSDIIKSSSIYETEPVDYENQPDFLNAAVKITTDYSPHKLLNKLKEIEYRLGRERSVKWGPRYLDLDIIFYGQLIVNDNDLIIPHPRAHLRKFVLVPVCEIDPDFIYPGLEMTVSQVLALISNNKHITKLNVSFTIPQQ